MAELGDLYQEIILEHNKAPRNFKKLEQANHHAEGYNPLCGDRCQVYIDMDGDAIKEIGFQLGFKTSSHFIAAFRREFATTPQEFRNRGDSTNAKLQLS